MGSITGHHPVWIGESLQRKLIWNLLLFGGSTGMSARGRDIRNWWLDNFVGSPVSSFHSLLWDSWFFHWSTSWKEQSLYTISIFWCSCSTNRFLYVIRSFVSVSSMVSTRPLLIPMTMMLYTIGCRCRGSHDSPQPSYPHLVRWNRRSSPLPAHLFLPISQYQAVDQMKHTSAFRRRSDNSSFPISSKTGWVWIP